jgi:tetratricopeptide (TPR) repeat protein
MLVSSARSKLAELLLIFLCVSCSHIFSVSASAANSISAQVNEQEPAQSEVDELVQTGFELYEKGEFEEALNYATRAKKLKPKDFRPYAIVGFVSLAQRKMEDASREFALAIRCEPKRKELYALKAKADAGRGAIDEAMASARKALEIDPKYGEAYAIVGEGLETDDRFQAEAISAYESGLRINPNQFMVYEALGQLLVKAKDTKKAEEIYRQGMAIDPKHMSGRFRLGRLLVEQGRLAEARQLWDARTSDEDKITPSFIKLLTRAENLKRASESLAQQPGDPNVLLEMGLAVMDGEPGVIDGRQERAIVYFKKALAIQPGFAKAQYNLVKAMVQYLAKDDNKLADEIGKLRQLDALLAKEMEDYRKTYDRGLIASPLKPDQ